MFSDIKDTILWVVVPFNPLQVNLHLQVEVVMQVAHKKRVTSKARLPFTMKMEAARSSQLSVNLYQTTWHYIPS
jgi:hypothetical protein